MVSDVSQTINLLAPLIGRTALGIYLSVFGFISVYYGLKSFLLAQKIRNLPTSKVRSVAVGLVELFGKARCAKVMQSPISKVRCVYWDLVCCYRLNIGRAKFWINFHVTSSPNLFNLEDDTGRILINPKNSEIYFNRFFLNKGYLSKDIVNLGSKDINASATDYLTSLGVNREALDQLVLDYLASNPEINKKFLAHAGSEIRVTERYIPENAPLYVLGTAESKQGSSSAVAHENLVVQKSKADNVLYLSDSNEKKILSNMSWSTVGVGVGFILLLLGLPLILITFFS